MRLYILLVLVITGCGRPSKSVQQQVFDDYLLLHLMSWSDAVGHNYVPDVYYEPGDTIRLRTKLRMLIIPHDTATRIDLDDKSVLELDSGTLVKCIREEKNSLLEISVNINDSTFIGMLSTSEIQEAEWGETYLNLKRRALVEQLAKLKKENLSELSAKYKLSEDSIMNLVSHEYFARTGRHGINY